MPVTANNRPRYTKGHDRRDHQRNPRARVTAALRSVTVLPLAGLRGPGSCRINLPVEVCWSLPPERRWFHLTDPDQVSPWMASNCLPLGTE
jgi:hypothetical protein